MKSDKRRSLGRPLAIGLALGVAAMIGLSPTTGPALAAPGPTSLDEAVGAQARQQQRANPSLLPTAPVIDHMRTEGDWAFGAVTLPVNETAEAPTSALYVAQRTGKDWKVGLEGTDTFRDLIKRAPESVVSKAEKETFGKQQAAAADAESTLVPTGLALPWRQGASWYMGGGPHGNSGSSRPFNSIDFNGGDNRVLSAAAGLVYKTCVRNNSALVRVVHSNGYTTTYYHMTNLITSADGTQIAAGTYLGMTGVQLPCGGSASGRHVHFSLYNGNTAVAVNDKTIGGWTFYEGASPYRGYAERNGVRVGQGGQLTNYGVSSTPEPVGAGTR